MKLFFVIDETVFFHPQFMEEFLNKTDDDVVGTCLVTKIGEKNNIERYMLKKFYNLRVSEMVKLGCKKIGFLAADKFKKDECYTVESVLKKYTIPYIKVGYDINRREYLDYIKSKEPDVIVSSQSLYFGKEILGIPKICCINRHSGLLPRNGGLWPGFQAVRKGETETGVSIHLMTSKIDDGQVISQAKVPICAGETLCEIYKECFEASSGALLEAMRKIKANDYTPISNGFNKEYYSFPTQEQWKEFRMRGGKYI